MDPSKIESNDLRGIYSELANLLGVEAALKIYVTYHGQQISFPIHLYSKEFVREQIIKEYNGKNLKQLATKYDYSEKWVRKIISEHKKGE